ncbi:MAG TPA: dihydroneopterin aldolase [Actinomycetes bacterium]|nr:dihydroneopterin aldolase [Actinomycetes bacterium]
MADRIDVRGLSGRGRHGVYDHERAEGQRFVVDLALWLDTRAAAAADELSATVDYGSLAGQVVDLIEGEPVALIETLAQRIATLCLTEPAIDTVEVTVHKPQAPITVPFDDVSVTITRSRT